MSQLPYTLSNWSRPSLSESFFESFKGYIHTERFAVYNGTPNTRIDYCWAHARRKYLDGLKAISNQNEKEANLYQQGIKKPCHFLY